MTPEEIQHLQMKYALNESIRKKNIETQEHKDRLRSKHQLVKYLYVVHNISWIDVKHFIENNYEKIGNHYKFVG